jgi:hypothetical protein
VQYFSYIRTAINHFLNSLKLFFMKKTFLISLIAIAMTIASFAQPTGGIQWSNYDPGDCYYGAISYPTIEVYNAQATYYEVRARDCIGGYISNLVVVDNVVSFRFFHTSGPGGKWAVQARPCNGDGCSDWSAPGNSTAYEWVYTNAQTPGTPSGESAPVQGVWEDYDVSDVVGADSYEWKITGGYFFAEGSGGSPYSSGTVIETSNSDIDLKFVSPPYTNYTITVRGVSDECGEAGSYSSGKTVTVAIP